VGLKEFNPLKKPKLSLVENVKKIGKFEERVG
jgi:hypothetical protein